MAPPVCYILVPMSNAEDGVDDALLAKPTIDECFVPGMKKAPDEKDADATHEIEPALTVSAGRGRAKFQN